MNIFELLEQRAKVSPGDVYVIEPTREHTFEDIHARAQARADVFYAQGMREGDTAAVIGSRSVAVIEALFALLKLGVTIVPLDIDEPVQRVRSLLARVAPRFAVVEEGVALDAPSGTQVLTIDADVQGRIASSGEVGSPASRGADACAFTFFTTGSTGLPKGIELSHSAIISGQRWLQRALALAPSDRQLFRTTLGVTNLLREVIWPVVAGCGCCLLPRGKHNDVAAQVETIDRLKVTVIGTVPILVDALITNRSGSRSLTSLRRIICTSDMFLGEQLARVQTALPDAMLFNVYGLTEAPYISFHVCSASDAALAAVPIGRAADLTAHILDEAMNEVEPGTVGRLYVSGIGRLSGYWANPELTRERLVTWHETQVFDTGDLASRDVQGCIHLAGRSEYLIKIGGHRADVLDLEQTMRTLPDIRDACIVPYDIGGGVKRLAAWIVADHDALLDESGVRKAIAGVLPAYMIPTMIRFVEALPRTHNGKTDKAALVRLLQPEGGSGDAPKPQSVLEIIASVLNISRLDPQRNIVELGGDSISAFLISVRAHEAGFDIDPSTLLARPIAEVALAGRRVSRAAQESGAAAPNALHELDSYGWSQHEIDQLLSVI